ncbi:MAG: hypothetical protein ACKO96_13905 [Flammeovirgaceae bacterium]
MKKILIIFPGFYLAYSPTTLNVFYELSKYFQVDLIAPEPVETYSLLKVKDTRISYLKFYRRISIYQRICNYISKKAGIIFRKFEKVNLINTETSFIINRISNFSGEIIAIDFKILWCAQQAGKSAHFISLEIPPQDDVFREHCKDSMIKSVLIQDQRRYDYLFKQKSIPVFFVQNSPPDSNLSVNISKRDKHKLIFCGSAIPEFGIFSLLDFLNEFPEYTLTIKGVIPPAVQDIISSYYVDILRSNRLYYCESYMDNEALSHFLNDFRIGFVFYDFHRFEQLRTFNYYTAPSGKMFQYCNSGVPCIGNRLPESSLIEEYNFGELVDSLGPSQIKTAIDKIESDYEKYALNSKEFSRKIDFNKAIKTYKDFLIECS